MLPRTVSAITDTIIGAKAEVQARADYLPHTTADDDETFIFAYEIIIRNVGAIAFQLLSRFWKITDGNGNVREVHGDGVIGKQPRLAPQEAFCYTSHVDMPTPTGSMRGTYAMRLDDGCRFIVNIPQFSLIVPSKVN